MILRTRRAFPKPAGSPCQRIACLTMAVVIVLPAHFLPAYAQQQSPGAAALQATRNELLPQLSNNAFKEPIYLTSREEKKQIEGDIYAEVANPFADVTAAFKSARTVCELVILHLNVRACQASGNSGSETVNMALGPKRAMTSGELYRISYALRIEADTPAYFKASMRAQKGPLGTHDYRIVFEAMPTGSKQSFAHFSYSYSYDTMAKMAMDLYLATAGRNKIGFTVVGQNPDGQALHVSGERGSLERNVMRYYLALLAYSSITAGTPQEKMEARLKKWFALTERYPAQLHELELKEYLEEKRAELARSSIGAK